MADCQVFRSLVDNSLRKGAVENAILLCEELVQMSSTSSDMLLLARAYYQKGAFRRSLTVLEQGNLLSSDAAIKTICSVFSALAPTDDNLSVGIATSDVKDALCVALLAAECLFQLEEYLDCLELLGPIVIVEDDEISMERIISRARALLPDPSEINTMAGILLLLVQCRDDFSDLLTEACWICSLAS